MAHLIEIAALLAAATPFLKEIRLWATSRNKPHRSKR